MIEKHFAAEQVNRFSGLDWFPREAAPLKELTSAMQSAANEFIAEYVTGEWLREEIRAPKPAELRRMIWGENEKRENLDKQKLSACRICGGTGFQIISRGPYTGARECPCRTQEVPPFPECGPCQGLGYYGGQIGGRYHGVWKWCDCAAGAEAQRTNPELVDVANRERSELMDRLIKRTGLIAALAADTYHGEF